MSTNLPATKPAVPGVPESLLNSLRGKIDKIEGIFTAATAKIAQLVSDPRVRVGATADELREARQETDAAVATVRAVAQTDLAQLRGETERERSDVMSGIARAIGRTEPQNATEALLREQREARAWGRIKPQLDLEPAQYGPIWIRVRELALNALAAGDEDALAALRAELLAYFQGRGLASNSAAEGVKQLDELIGQERPAVAAALALQREVETGTYAVMLGINYATSAIMRGAQQTTIPEWDAQRARRLAMPGVDLQTGRVNPKMGQRTF
jgi:hypothetical protein